jgi:hypothetical protein
MKVVICRLRCDASGHESIGAGRTQTQALDDAITHFHVKPRAMMLDRIKRRVANPHYYEREVQEARARR